MTEALKPCPFCGGTKLAAVGPDGGFFKSGGYVICEACNIKTDVEWDVDAAISVWNRRATPTPAQPDPLHVANERGEGEDAKDAARYRFLRDSDGLDEEIAGLNQCHWDKVIDAAMAAAPKEKP